VVVTPAPFGNFDQGQLQRGFKVYKEVCQTCHGLSLVSFRNLAEAGRPGLHAGAGGCHRGRIQDSGRAERPGRDVRARRAHRRPFPAAVDLEERGAGQLLYNGTVPPDMSVLAKARSYERGFPGS
jgi:ubiquinol-cytochrome c reductase cytochrome b/c1 subunit